METTFPILLPWIDNLWLPVLQPSALIDGRTPDQCLMCWMENRSLVERGGHWMRYRLTPAQILTARAMWSEKHGTAWSAALRVKVNASRAEEEARRPSVRVEVDE